MYGGRGKFAYGCISGDGGGLRCGLGGSTIVLVVGRTVAAGNGYGHRGTVPWDVPGIGVPGRAEVDGGTTVDVDGSIVIYSGWCCGVLAGEARVYRRCSRS